MGEDDGAEGEGVGVGDGDGVGDDIGKEGGGCWSVCAVGFR